MPNYPQSESIYRFFTKGQPLTFGKGDVLIGNSPQPEGVYYIGTGYVKIYSITDDGDEYLHIIHGHGEVFPMTWAYLGLESDFLFYEALSATTVWRVAREVFIDNLKKDHEFCFAMSEQLAQQFRMYADRIDNLEYKKASDRVVYRLLYLAARFGKHEGDLLVIDAPITHELFAHSINLARESVSRQFETLEAEGLLKHSEGRLMLPDVAALGRKLSQPGGLKNWGIL